MINLRLKKILIGINVFFVLNKINISFDEFDVLRVMLITFIM